MPRFGRDPVDKWWFNVLWLFVSSALAYRAWDECVGLHFNWPTVKLVLAIIVGLYYPVRWVHRTWTARQYGE